MNELKERMKHVNSSIKAIHEKHGSGKPESQIFDSIECPQCKGVLEYTVSSYNGHIHGRCKTDDCLSWMQ